MTVRTYLHQQRTHLGLVFRIQFITRGPSLIWPYEEVYRIHQRDLFLPKIGPLPPILIRRFVNAWLWYHLFQRKVREILRKETKR